MNLILLEAAELKDDNTVEVSDRRSQHIVEVLGAQMGDTLKAGIINGPIGNVEVLSINSNGDPASVKLLWTSQGQVPVKSGSGRRMIENSHEKLQLV